MYAQSLNFKSPCIIVTLSVCTYLSDEITLTTLLCSYNNTNWITACTNTDNDIAMYIISNTVLMNLHSVETLQLQITCSSYSG